MPSSNARRLVLSVLPIVAMGLSATVFSEEQPSSDLQRTVDGLIRQLASEQLTQRRQAEEELLRLGPRILPLLPAPELLPSISVRETVRKVRSVLEHRQARESVLPSRVTLRRDGTLFAAVAAITEQTGNALEIGDEVRAELLNRPLGVECVDRPFWPVLDEVLSRTGLQIPRDATSRGLVLTSPMEGPESETSAVAYSGPFRLVVQPASVRELPGDAEHRLLRVPLALRAEPRLRPLFVQVGGKDIAASLPDGRRLEPFSPEAKLELPITDAAGSLELVTNFKVPPLEEFPPVALQGKLRVQLAAGSERIAFRRLSEARRVARRRGGVTVTLNEVNFHPQDSGGQNIEVDVSVSYDSGGRAFESHRTWMFHNEVFLETPAGRMGPNAGFETRLQTDGGVRVVYRFRDVNGAVDDYRFVYVAPTLIIEVPVEFEFKQIPVERAADVAQ